MTDQESSERPSLADQAAARTTAPAALNDNPTFHRDRDDHHHDHDHEDGHDHEHPFEWREAVRIAWVALAAVVFLETGAMAFFLPGDSLLVIAGFFASRGELSLGVLNALLMPLAIAGDACSYSIGRHLGPRLFTRPTSRLFKPGHLRAADAFYARHGGKAIVLARFVPVVRTFIPVVAGIAGMAYSRFFAFNVVGGVGWVGSLTSLGYLLGARFPWLRERTEVVVLAVVAVSLLPVLLEAWRARRRGAATPAPDDQ